MVHRLTSVKSKSMKPYRGLQYTVVCSLIYFKENKYYPLKEGDREPDHNMFRIDCKLGSIISLSLDTF